MQKCSICTQEGLKQVNQLLAQGKSLRYVALHILGAENKFMSVARHAENCLNFDVVGRIKELKIDSAEQYHEEIREQLSFARDLRQSARDYLTDENGNLSLLPRSDEIDIVFFDYTDLDEKKLPKKKTAKLDYVLQEIYKDGAKQADKWSVKHVDIRPFALECIKTADVVLDKIAKLEGLYTKDKPNPAAATLEYRAETYYKNLIAPGDGAIPPQDAVQLTKDKFGVDVSKLVDVQEIGGVN